MAKEKPIFVCDNCGFESLTWAGKCSACGEWNTFKQLKKISTKMSDFGTNAPAQVLSLDQIKIQNFQRLNTTIEEFDRVLGGGILPSSIVLLAGEPGIGKSTLLLQIADTLSSKNDVLYVSGEESAQQLKMRCQRLKISSKNLKILSTIQLPAIIEACENYNPSLLIVDSIQSIYESSFPATAGSPVQIRECTLRLQNLAKTTSTAVIVVGHITKEGAIAGPKLLEHIVDVVLYIEGQRFYDSRILQCIKNRFGPTDEIGVFQMGNLGLVEIKNPSKIFLEHRLKNVAGSTVSAVIEGTRAFLVEIQALCTATNFGYPLRRASGFDLNRLLLIIAVLQKRAGLALYNQDVFVNVVGGLKIKEPAADLAVALAIASALKNKVVFPDVCAFGEVGLSGEVRKVVHFEKRAKEANRLGFNKILDTRTVLQAIKNAFES